jgi:Flp pilus assembly pilin Flp
MLHRLTRTLGYLLPGTGCVVPLAPIPGRSTRRCHAAQNVIEYGLLLATIALVVLLGVAAFGNVIQPWFISLAGRITTVGT